MVSEVVFLRKILAYALGVMECWGWASMRQSTEMDVLSVEARVDEIEGRGCQQAAVPCGFQEVGGGLDKLLAELRARLAELEDTAPAEATAQVSPVEKGEEATGTTFSEKFETFEHETSRPIQLQSRMTGHGGGGGLHREVQDV